MSPGRVVAITRLPPNGLDVINPLAVQVLAPEVSRLFRVLPIDYADGVITMAMTDPIDDLTVLVAGSFAERRFGASIHVQLVDAPTLVAAINRVHGPPPPPDPPPSPSDAPDTKFGLRRIGALEINPLAVQVLEPDVSRKFRVLPIGYQNGVVTVAMSDPIDELTVLVARSFAERRLGASLHIELVDAATLDAAIEHTHGPAPPVAEVISIPAPFAPPELEPGPAPEPKPAPQAKPEPEPVPELELEPAPQAQPLRGGPHRIGTLLIAAGLADAGEVVDALATQRRTGERLGEILVHDGRLQEEHLVALVANQLELPAADISSAVPDLPAVELVTPRFAHRHRIVPLDVHGGRLRVAVADATDDAALDELRARVPLPIDIVLATQTSIDALLQRIHGPAGIEDATQALLLRTPEDSAYRVLSRGQKIVFAAIVLAFLIGLVIDPIRTVIVFNVLAVGFYIVFSLYRFKLIQNELAHDLELPVQEAEVAALDERTLPVYTILVPLYHEANVIPQLLDAIAAIEYPPSRLDVKLLVEEDDDETIAAIRAHHPPPHFKLVVVPDAAPKTKPKACNYGLLQARGDYVVIYDAEDRPEADQLKKVLVAFGKAEPWVACIQCKLNFYNRSQNLLTRWFTTEYSMWFDLFMPGLDAADAPIPLGGTSNHFHTETLLELGAWDPFNVTEDADLGIRLSKAGYKTAMVDSTTHEEANPDLYNWIRQRSRWVKGYIQTWLVHMRHPLQLIGQIGIRRFISFQLVVGGTFVGFLLNPVYWALTSIWILSEANVIRSVFPGFLYYAAAVGLIVGNFVFLYLSAAGSMRRGYFDLVKYALFSPVYWGLMSIAAWKGALQLITKPHYWEKTIHGLDEPE